MGTMASFLHLADLHIGLRITRFDPQVTAKLQEARFQALDAAILEAERRRADFLLIAGDLFDDNTVSATDAQRVHAMLRDRARPVYVLPGNHDPSCAGSVWQRAPWSGPDTGAVHLLTDAKPVQVSDGVVLLPCPVTAKRSSRDPTAWMEPGGKTDHIRIGLAHGSMRDRDYLPEDDHPIAIEVPTRLGLDYLALGHWHSHRSFRALDGAVRAAYPGTAEQMGFAEGAFDLGWRAYAPDPTRSEFRGGASGSALFVRIAGPGAAPEIERVPIGRCSWREEEIEISDATFDDVFSEIARRPDPERQLLRLTLKGVLSAEKWQTLQAFQEMLRRYLHCELDESELHVRPEAGPLAEAVGSGLLREVWRRLEARVQSPEKQPVAERALLLLYQLAREAQS